MDIIDKIKHYSTKAVKFIKNKLPQNNPEVLISEAESKIEKSKQLAGKQLLAIQEMTASIKRDMKTKESELIGIKECIKIATADRDEALLVSLLMEEEAAEDNYMWQKKLYDGAVADAVRISENHRRFESDINAMLKELSNLKSRAQFLKMREQITLVENRFEQQTLNAAPRRDFHTSNDIMPPKSDLIKQNSSRKKAQERAFALLQIRE